jgi:hypothetical protein
VYRSGNSLQDHSLGPVEGRTDYTIRENVIVDNFLDMDPIIEPKRQQSHIPVNTWNIGVGNDPTLSPNATVMAHVATAGLEAPYLNLLTGSEEVRKKAGSGLYWSDMYTSIPFVMGAEVLWLGLVAIAGLGMAGGVVIFKQKISRPVTAERKFTVGGSH